MGKRPKYVIQKESVSNQKKPKTIENPDGYLKKHPIWAFQRCDMYHEKWSIKNCNSFYEEILDKLISFEGQTWAEIQSAAGGRRNGTNSHFENVCDLTKDAQKRIKELKLDIDQIFSLRLTATLRLYGILEDGVFNILWYDPNHEIYESKKSHT